MNLISALVLIMTTTNLPASVPTIPPCPASPNCVSSLASDSHRIEPFAIKGKPAAAFTRLQGILSGRDDTTLIAADDRVIRVEFRTFLGFVDDAMFVLDPSRGVIQIRSAARTGYWDLGKNRRRLEEIRSAYEQP